MVEVLLVGAVGGVFVVATRTAVHQGCRDYGLASQA